MKWQSIETARKDGTTFLVVQKGHIERWDQYEGGDGYTTYAPPRAVTCAWFSNDDSGDCGFIDEFGEWFRLDGIVHDAEDMTAADDILRMHLWTDLPEPPEDGE